MDLVDGYPLQNVNDVEDPAGTRNIKTIFQENPLSSFPSALYKQPKIKFIVIHAISMYTVYRDNKKHLTHYSQADSFHHLSIYPSIVLVVVPCSCL